MTDEADDLSPRSKDLLNHIELMVAETLDIMNRMTGTPPTNEFEAAISRQAQDAAYSQT